MAVVVCWVVATHVFATRSLTAAAGALLTLGLLSGQASAQLAQSSLVSADPADETPHVSDGSVRAIVQIGDTVVVGGTFTQVRAHGATEPIKRSRIFAFDARTGQISTTFKPRFNAAVLSLAAAPDGESIYVGGAFTIRSGVPSRKVVRLSLTDGTRWPGFQAPTINGVVKDLKLSGGRLYVAGAYKQIGGQARGALAALNAKTGKINDNVKLGFADPLRGGQLQVLKMDISPDGSRLVAIGNFSKVLGMPRYQLAVLDLTTVKPTLVNWSTARYQPDCSPRFDTYMRDVDISPDGTYFVVVTSGAYRKGLLCDTAARWELGSTGLDVQPSWVNYTGGDTLFSVAVTGAAVYIGGHQRWTNNPYRADRAGPGAVERYCIAALDPLNGLPYTWNPRRDPRGVGVFDMLSTAEGLWVGSDTNKIGGEWHEKVAFLPLAGGLAVPADNLGQLPNDVYLLGRRQVDGTYGDDAAKSSFDGTTAEYTTTVLSGLPWSHTRGAFMLNGYLYYGWDDGTLRRQSFDGTTLGDVEQLELHGLAAGAPSYFGVKSITGMFFDNGRLYYTQAGQRQLFYRYFTAESGTVGAERFVASGNLKGLDWSKVNSMFFDAATDTIYAVTGTTRMKAVSLVDGRPDGSVRPVSVSGGWQSRGALVFAGKGATAGTS